MDGFKYVIFRLGEQKYGMNLMYINGIEEGCRIVPVPNAPEGIKGIISLRKAVIPVYSLRERFGMEPQGRNVQGSLLITNSSGTTLAYEVDGVIGIEEMNPERVAHMPKIASNEETALMEEVLHIGKEIVIAISVDKVLSSEMIANVNRLVEENK
jgi:purine-binding chemotaxis protein CheW